ARDLLAAGLGVARGEREEDVRRLSGRAGAVNVGRDLAGAERREAEREAEHLAALVEGEERQPERRAGRGRRLLGAVQEREEGLRARGPCGQRDERGQQGESERRAVTSYSHVILLCSGGAGRIYASRSTKRQPSGISAEKPSASGSSSASRTSRRPA